MILAAGALFPLLAVERDPTVSMHRDDWRDPEGGMRPRAFRSPGQFIHHLKELFFLQAPLARVYLLREMDAAFREQIMIMTAMVDQCPG